MQIPMKLVLASLEPRLLRDHPARRRPSAAVVAAAAVVEVPAAEAVEAAGYKVHRHALLRACTPRLAAPGCRCAQVFPPSSPDDGEALPH